jgi:hypothetical protein
MSSHQLSGNGRGLAKYRRTLFAVSPRAGTRARSKPLHDESNHAIGNQESAMGSSENPALRQVVPARLTGHNVRHVLGFSIAAVVIVFVIIWIVYFA